MNKTVMLECLINYYTDGNKTRFASMVGVTPQLISNWLSRNTFDAEVIFNKCKNVSASWLLSGCGEMIIDDKQGVEVKVPEADRINKELIELCKQLISNYKQRDNIIEKLVAMTNMK